MCSWIEHENSRLPRWYYFVVQRVCSADEVFVDCSLMVFVLTPLPLVHFLLVVRQKRGMDDRDCLP